MALLRRLCRRSPAATAIAAMIAVLALAWIAPEIAGAPIHALA